MFVVVKAVFAFFTILFYLPFSREIFEKISKILFTILVKFAIMYLYNYV